MKLQVVCYLAVCVCAAWASIQAHDTKQCAKGPTYWCKNITTAAACKAVPHCIQTVWEHQKLPSDRSTVCETCLEMVKEARDQLLSNETQDELRQVFEGSCKLIPVKVVANACIKLLDEFMLELVDVLASQMNPQVVCSVAGLCNNQEVNRLLEETQKGEAENGLREKLAGCKSCHAVVNSLERKFRQSSPDSVLQNMIAACDQMGSLSTTCVSVISKHFNKIYSHLEDNLKSSQLCHIAGECSAIFHKHLSKKEFEELSASVDSIKMGDNEMCRSCKQVFKRIKDVLIGGTTEAEFKQSLLGWCKYTESFKDECIKIVNDYSPVIYHFLANDFNETVICAMLAICPRPGMENIDGPAPSNTDSLTNVQNSELCMFCEYFLHFVQHALTEPKTMTAIKRIVDRICNELPNEMNKTCCQFVEVYSGPIIAMLVQEIDPSVICPELKICPGFQLQNVNATNSWPLCLLVAENLEEMLDNSEDNLHQALSTVCSHLHKSVQNECQNFVKTHYDFITKIYLPGITPVTICKYLNSRHSTELEVNFGGNTATNEISDSTSNGKAITDSSECLVCAYIMSEVNYEMKTNATQEEVQRIVKGICDHLPNTNHTQCSKFIKRYGDIIVRLLMSGMHPSVVCKELVVCTESKKENVGNLECELCKKVLEELEHSISGHPTEEKVVHALEHVCKIFPRGLRHNCDKFVKKHGKDIIKLLVANVLPKEVCKMMQLCGSLLETPKATGSTGCELCKKVLKEIESLLIDKLTEDEIIKAVHQACEKVPKLLRKECNSFIDKHGDEIIEMLEQNVLPGQVCAALQLCNELISSSPAALCPVCNALLKKFQKSKITKVREEIIVSLYEECTTTPSFDDCNKFVKEYGLNIAQSLQTLQPQEVCDILLPCATEFEQAKLDVRSCAICNHAAHQMGNTLQNPQGNHSQEHVLQTSCGSLPTKQQELCEGIILFNSEKMSKMLLQGDSPIKVCSRIGLCQLDEINKCNRGPGYWCTNQTTAKECEMVDHCRETVWHK